MAAITTGVLARIGVFLSALGCFAVFSSMVAESRNELALRIALGTTPSGLLRAVLIIAIE